MTRRSGEPPEHTYLCARNLRRQPRIPHEDALGRIPHEDALGRIPHEDALGRIPHEDALGRIPHEDALPARRALRVAAKHDPAPALSAPAKHRQRSVRWAPKIFSAPLSRYDATMTST